MSEVTQHFGQEPPYEEAANDKIAQAAISILSKRGLINNTDVPWAKARLLLARCMNGVQIDQSAITTRMSRLLFAIAHAHRPSTALVVGSFQAGSLMWIAEGAGPGCRCVGVDIDEAANKVAIQNLAAVSLERVEIHQHDGHKAGVLFNGKIDLLLLDAESQVEGQSSKAIYVTLLMALLPYLSDRALVLAHDACWPKFASDFEAFEVAVKQAGIFGETQTVEIDRYGLLVVGRSSND